MLLVKIVRSTGEGHLRYGICVPCSKRLPGVRDAFSGAFGVKNRLLRYGRDIRCQKQPSVVRDASSKSRRTADSTDCGQPPGVRDAFSEAFGVKNRLLRYGRDIRYRKRPPTVRDASSKARRTADSTDCGQPPMVRDAFSEACRATSSLLPHRTHLQCAKRPPRSLFAPAAPSLAPSTALGARNDPRSDVSRHKKKEGDLSVYQDFLELPAAPVLLPPHAYIAASAPSSKKNKKRGCIP